MARDRVQFGVKIRRFLVVPIRTCYRSVCNRPFLVGMFCILMLLYRTNPLLFSLLASASPILVCTAVLLGTILSFGQPNIPEIEKEPEVTHEIASFRTEVVRDATVVEKDESFRVERYVEKRGDVMEDGNEEVRLGESRTSEVEEDNGSVGYKPLVDESSHELEPVNHVMLEERGFDLEIQRKREIFVEKVKEDDENEAMGGGHTIDGGSLGDMIDDAKEEHIDTSPVSPWRPMRLDEDEEDDADRDDSLDSGSDGAESSSPDASMTDIIPMLDELHPLLESEAPQPTRVSPEGSEAASEGPHRGSDEGIDSDTDSEDQAEEGAHENDDEKEEEEEEEDTKEDKEDESKSVIKWTEEDQKNLMDLGTSELERNQRLENLIARRRARKSMRLMAEKNLIDLDTTDIPFHLPSIATARPNPFDIPYDSYDDMGLPPIPGSAPSILLPRRNPFDIPYEPNEEKPDLKGDSFQEEFAGFHQKDPIFRRHESFNVGPSIFGAHRHERHDFRFRPFFVPERLADEGTTHYSFERQLSEISESKVSSVPDTESVISTGLEEEEEEKTINEHNIDPETADRTSVHDEHSCHVSEDDDSVDFELAENRNAHRDVPEITLGGGESHHEEHLNMPVEVETHDNRDVGTDITLGGGDSRHEERSYMSEAVETHGNRVAGEKDYSDSESALPEVDEDVPPVRKEEESTSLETRGDSVEESGVSAQASFEESEIHFTSRVEDDHQHEETVKESFISAQASLEESEIHSLSAGEDDHHHKEPLYDSSPSSVVKCLSFSSVSSDNQVEMSEMGDQQKIECADKESEEHSRRIDRDTSNFEEMLTAPTVHASNENESRPKEVLEISEHDVKELGGLSSADTRVDVQNESGHVSSDKYETAYHQQDQVPLSVSGLETHSGVHADVKETVDSGASSNGMVYRALAPTSEEPPSKEVADTVSTLQPHLSSMDTEHREDLNMDPDPVHGLLETSVVRSVAEGAKHEEEAVKQEEGQAVSSSFDADIQVDSYSTLPSGGVEYVEEHSLNDEDSLQSERDQVRSSNSDGEVASHQDQATDVEVVSVNAVSHNVPSEEASPSGSNKEPAWSDKSMVEPSVSDETEHQEPSIIKKESVRVSFARNITFHVYHDAVDTTNLSSPTSDSSSPPAESPEYKTPMVGEGREAEYFDNIVYEDLDHASEQSDHIAETHGSHTHREVIDEEPDEIKEIDEGLLSELDTVGDFSVKEVVNTEPGTSIRDPNIEEERSESPVHEARSDEDTYSALEQIHEGAEVNEVKEVVNAEPGTSRRDSNVVEEKTELPIHEARSDEDIDSALEQIHVGAEVNEVKEVVNAEPGTSMGDSNVVEEKMELPVLEARSVEDIDSGFKQIHEGVEVNEVKEVVNPEPGTSRRCSNAVEDTTELPVLEARPDEDIDSALKQIHEGAEVTEVILPTVVEDQLAAAKSESSAEIKSELAAVEARSFEDINIALKQVSEENMDELPVLEARSAEDIGSAFKQIHEGTEVSEVILPSMVKDQLAAEKNTPTEIKSELAEIEAKSVEDMDIALKQASEDKVDELPKTSESESSSGQVEEVKYPVEIKSELPVVQERSLEDVQTPSNDGSEREAKAATGIKSGLPLVEVRSLDELPEASGSKEDSTDGRADKAISIEDMESSNVKSGFQEFSNIVADEQKIYSEEVSVNSNRKGKKEAESGSSSSSSSSSDSE